MAAPLLAGELEPARERALADPVAPRDLGLAALAGLVGRERPLAQVVGVGTRHRSPPVGGKATSTADRGAGSVDGRAIRSSREQRPRTRVGSYGRRYFTRRGGRDGRRGSSGRVAVGFCPFLPTCPNRASGAHNPGDACCAKHAPDSSYMN